MKAFATLTEKELADGKKFLTGEKISIADFKAFAMMATFTHNKMEHPVHQETYELSKKVLLEHEKTKAWIDTMASELEEYLAARPGCPM